jgi:triacylglycerol esterase/lipase EstA (alpha/beta hydrolase family)
MCFLLFEYHGLVRVKEGRFFWGAYCAVLRIFSGVTIGLLWSAKLPHSQRLSRSFGTAYLQRYRRSCRYN